MSVPYVRVEETRAYHGVAPRLDEERRAVLIHGDARDALGDAVHDAIRLGAGRWVRGDVGGQANGWFFTRVGGAGRCRRWGSSAYLGALVSASSMKPRRLAAPRRVHDGIRETRRGGVRGYRGEGAHGRCAAGVAGRTRCFDDDEASFARRISQQRDAPASARHGRR